MQQVMLCLTWVRLQGKPLPLPETQGPDRSCQVLESAGVYELVVGKGA